MRVRLGGLREERSGVGLGLAREHVVGVGAGTGPGVGAGAGLLLRLPAAYDLLDVPGGAGHRVLLQLERLGTPLGPVLTVQAAGAGREGLYGRGGKAGAGALHEGGGGGSRLQFFVDAGTTASFLADLKDLGWDPADTDVRTIGVVLACETPLPAAGSPRWVRRPETGRVAVLPPARLLLGALAYACRRAEVRRGYAIFDGSRSG